MHNYLKSLDYKVYERCKTLERNIKAGSNSFYDAYLDMLEELVKMIVQSHDVYIIGRETCGDLLRKQEVISFFKNRIQLDDYTFSKMQDYTIKVNKHKHNHEKNIQVDTIVSYMKIFHTIVEKYALYNGCSISAFDADNYISMFGSFERDNVNLKNEMHILKEELEESIKLGQIKESDVEKYKSLLSEKELAALTLEEQNNEMSKEISKLKDIKLAALESKLDKTIDLLNELTESVIENRAISYAVGDTICGRELFKNYVSEAKEDLNKK